MAKKKKTNKKNTGDEETKKTTKKKPSSSAKKKSGSRKKTSKTSKSSGASRSSKSAKSSKTAKTSKTAKSSGTGKTEKSKSSKKKTASSSGAKKTAAAAEKKPVKEQKARQETTEKKRVKSASAPASAKQAGPAQKAAAKQRKAKPRRTGFKVAGVLAAILIYCGVFITGAFAVDRMIINPDRFLKGTVINGVDVSGLDVSGARKKLTKAWNKHKITINDNDGKYIGEIRNFGFKYRIRKSLENAMHPGAKAALSQFVGGKERHAEIVMTPMKPSKEFNRQFNRLSIVDNLAGDKQPRNAYIDKSNTEFNIVKEVYGNSVDVRKVKKAVMKSIAHDNKEFNYRRDDYYTTPEITSTSQVLLDEQEYCRKYLTFSVRYRNSIDDYTVTPYWLDRMIKVNEQGKTTVKKAQVDQFLEKVLAPKFSSVGATRRLKSKGGGFYTISGGTYGYIVDQPQEKKKLTDELRRRVNVEREPIYEDGKAPSEKGLNDIGNDFVEVSIAKQTVWVVRNGKVKVRTPVVTGNASNHMTPTGTFYVVYKATNVTLEGRNDDGSEYESPVAYWVPFYLGFGLHDATWRGAFGGSIYLGNGSHGCVNCPPYIMPEIFANVYDGMPVIVH